MTEVSVVEGKAYAEQALKGTMDRMRDRGQQKFQNPLIIRQGVDDEEAYDKRYYIQEIISKRRLGVIPRKEYRNLLALDPGFWGGAYEQKEVRCAVYDKAMQNIAEEEVARYGSAVQATGVQITKEYTDH